MDLNVFLRLHRQSRVTHFYLDDQCNLEQTSRAVTTSGPQNGLMRPNQLTRMYGRSTEVLPRYILQSEGWISTRIPPEFLICIITSSAQKYSDVGAYFCLIVVYESMLMNLNAYNLENVTLLIK